MTEYDEHWIETFTGRKFHYLNPYPDEIDIRDIAHALSLKCRFNGHCREFYSVAEHSIRVANIVPGEYKLSALLHDATEAYMPDIPRPIKATFGLKEYEEKIVNVISNKYWIANSKVIKHADNVLLATEARDLMHMNDWAELPNPLSDKILPLIPHVAEAMFLNFAQELGLQIE